MCEEDSFPFISLLDENVIVSPPDVKFGEEGAATELIHYHDERGHIVVLLGPFIDWVVVLYEP
jgi:hypothetical protein